MLDKNVGDALLKLDLSPQTDAPSAQIERIIDTDRRRVQRWTRIAVALWVLAALGAFLIFVMGGLTFPAIAKLIMEENKAKAAGENVGAKAADQNKHLDPAREPLDEPYTPLPCSPSSRPCAWYSEQRRSCCSSSPAWRPCCCSFARGRRRSDRSTRTCCRFPSS